MSTKSIPEPDVDRHIGDLLHPIERKAEDFVLKQLRRFFGVRAIRAYFTTIFFGYLLDQVTIDFTQRKFRFVINDQQEFVIYAGIYLGFIVILSLLDFKESKFFAGLEQNDQMWLNFIQNIQPNIDDPDKKLLAMYSFKLEKTKNDLRDYFMKVMDEYIKEMIESNANLGLKVGEIQAELRDYEVLKDLANQIRVRKSKK